MCLYDVVGTTFFPIYDKTGDVKLPMLFTVFIMPPHLASAAVLCFWAVIWIRQMQTLRNAKKCFWMSTFMHLSLLIGLLKLCYQRYWSKEGIRGSRLSTVLICWFGDHSVAGGVSKTSLGKLHQDNSWWDYSEPSLQVLLNFSKIPLQTTVPSMQIFLRQLIYD